MHAEESEDLLARANLPRSPEPERGAEPPPEPPTGPSLAPPDVNAMLGRVHLTAAAGIGCSVAYIGVASGIGETTAGIAGLVAYCIAQGRLMMGIEERCTTKVLNAEGSVALPKDYMRGTVSVFYPSVLFGLMGYSHPETYATPTLVGLLTATALFWGLHSLQNARRDL
ncbi:MAG: hypothetical protein RL417_2281, partial [Pseudomonadota bacterium]